MREYIPNILFFILILFLIKFYFNKIKYIHNDNYLQSQLKLNLSKIFSNCNLTNNKLMNVRSNYDYIKYLNILSCKCRGIGYWGGFCLKKEKIYVGGNQAHDIGLSNALANLFKDKTVVDLGAGLGWYCPIISKTAKRCDQYDGSVNIEEITHNKVKYLNLAEPIKKIRKYDIVMSLEVAEHIPKIYEDIYINNLVNSSKEAILITWSRVGQPGHFHVNNKNREDVIQLFLNKGLHYDDNISNRLKNVTTIGWLKNNILYFSK